MLKNQRLIECIKLTEELTSLNQRLADDMRLGRKHSEFTELLAQISEVKNRLQELHEERKARFYTG